MKSLNKLVIICVMAVLISSCQIQSALTTSPSEVPTLVTLPTATNVPAIVATETATSIPAQTPLVISPKGCAASNGQLPSLSNPEISSVIRPVNNTLGGGLVQSKEFTIELFLYCDSVFQPNSADFISDIGGLAIYYNWRYDAPNKRGSGVIYGYFGIAPDIQWGTGEGPSTGQGHVSQGQSVGIRLPSNNAFDFSKSTPLRFIYILQSEYGQLSGAVLSFDIQQISDGLQPSNILVTPLSDIELKSLESIKSLAPPLAPTSTP